MFAVEESDAKMTETLVDLGASVDVVDNQGSITLTPTVPKRNTLTFQTYTMTPAISFYFLCPTIDDLGLK